MANPHRPLQKRFPHLLTVSFSGFLLSSETHLAKITISTSCYAHGKMNPDVWNTEPVAALLSYAEMTVSQIRALLPAVPDFGGPCQNKARVLPAFCWKRGTYLLFQLVLPHSAGHHSAAVSRLTCGWKSCRIKKEAQRHVSETEKTRILPGLKCGVTLQYVLEGLPCCPLPVTHGNCAAILSQGVSEPEGVNEYQLHSVGHGKCLVQRFVPLDACSGG